MSGPTPLNILLWYGVYETQEDYRIGYWSVLDPPGPIRWDRYAKGHALLTPYLSEYGVERLRWFSNGFHVIRETENGDLLFYLLKYGRTKYADSSAAGSFAFHYTISPQQDGQLNYEVKRSVEDTDLMLELGRMYRRMLGDTAAMSRSALE